MTVREKFEAWWKEEAEASGWEGTAKDRDTAWWAWDACYRQAIEDAARVCDARADVGALANGIDKSHTVAWDLGNKIRELAP